MRLLNPLIAIALVVYVALVVLTTTARAGEHGWTFVGPDETHTVPAAPELFHIDGNGVVTPKPLSAIVVTQCGGALALFIQLDATHLMRADPVQSDLFTNVNGKMVQGTAPPMKWDDAYNMALQAVLSSHVIVPCTETGA